jgi:hypothetical protein
LKSGHIIAFIQKIKTSYQPLAAQASSFLKADLVFPPVGKALPIGGKGSSHWWEKCF